MTNSEILHRTLKSLSSHYIKHIWRSEAREEQYPEKLCRRAAQKVLKLDRWKRVQQQLQQAALAHAISVETEQSAEQDEAILASIFDSEKSKLGGCFVICPIGVIQAQSSFECSNAGNIDGNRWLELLD